MTVPPFPLRGFRPLFLAAVLALPLTATSASAQEPDMGALMDRIDRLERDIRTLNIQLARGGTAPKVATGDAPASSLPAGSPAALANLDVRITTMEGELRALTGRVEESMFRFDQINQRLDKLVGDLEYRLGALESGAPMAPGQGMASGQGVAPGMAMSPTGGAPAPMAAVPSVAPVASEGEGTTIISGSPRGGGAPRMLGTISQSDLAPVQPAQPAMPAEGVPGMEGATPAQPQTMETASAPPASVLPAGSPREQYAHAFGLLRRAEYDQAEAALTAFIEAHPEDPLSANARYWLGETYYVRADYVRAAEVFLLGYQDAPKGPKAPDTLLKLGMSLGNLDKQAQACATFDKLGKDFPDAPAVIKRKVEGERARNGCK